MQPYKSQIYLLETLLIRTITHTYIHTHTLYSPCSHTLFPLLQAKCKCFPDIKVYKSHQWHGAQHYNGVPRAAEQRSVQPLLDIRGRHPFVNSSPTVSRLHSWLTALRVPLPCLRTASKAPRIAPPAPPPPILCTAPLPSSARSGSRTSHQRCG